MFIINLMNLVTTWYIIIDTLSYTGRNKLYVDEWCLGTLIQGVCFRYLEQEGEAVRCFVAIKERYTSNYDSMLFHFKCYSDVQVY